LKFKVGTVIITKEKSLVPIERIERSIILIRGSKVMLDSDLDVLYGVTTKRLNEQVKRNISRFPEDFMFQLTWDEYNDLRSQIATSKKRGGRRYPPYVFTEHGVVMLASVLDTEIAINASIQVVKAFLRLRQLIESNRELAKRLDELEKKYDSQFKTVFEAIRRLMIPDAKEQRRIGFRKETFGNKL